jgi:hypothetical protein
MLNTRGRAARLFCYSAQAHDEKVRPDWVSHVNFFAAVAETILRTAKDGERNPAVLERMGLLELQI